MSFSDRRAMRHMKFPERGVLRVTGIREGHLHARITGIITAPGMAPANVEHKVDHKSEERGRWTGVSEVAVLVDRADPTKFVILWDEPVTPDPTRAASPLPGQYGPGAGVPGLANLPSDIAARVEESLGRALSQLPPDKAARVEAAMNRAFGQAGGPGAGLGQALSQAFGQAAGQQYGPPGGQQYGQPGGPPYGPPSGQGGPPFGQGGQAPGGFPQVSWADQNAPGSAPQAGFSPAGGELASAIVVSAQDVAPMPGFAAPASAVDLTLEVRRADGSAYTAYTRVSVTTPERRAAVATPGTQLQVTIDPNDPARVNINTPGLF